MHLLHEILFYAPSLVWCFLPCLNFGSGGTKSTTNQETNTSSGASSPNASGGSQAVGPGSIGVAGTGAKYLEQGATDYAGAQVGGVSGSSLNASGGATITIGDPNAVNALGQIADQLANAVTTPASTGGGGGGGGGITTWLQPLTQNINWSLIAIVGAVLIGLYLFFGRKRP